jgi:hypothetical protein
MQRFERMAAEREREAAAKRSAQDDDPNTDRPPAAFLNETAYDRRKQVTAETASAVVTSQAVFVTCFVKAAILDRQFTYGIMTLTEDVDHADGCIQA